MAMAGARAAVAQGRLAGHDHRPPLLGLDVLDVQLWILGAKLNKQYRLQLFFETKPIFEETHLKLSYLRSGCHLSTLTTDDGGARLWNMGNFCSDG